MSKMLLEYVYAVRGERLAAWKLGRWTGLIPALQSRYRTYYGSAIDLVVFQCVDSTTVETDMLNVLAPHNWCHELFEMDVLPAFLEYGRQRLMDNITSAKYFRIQKKAELKTHNRKSEREISSAAVAQFVVKNIQRTDIATDYVQKGPLYQLYKQSCTDTKLGKHKWFELMKKHLGGECHSQKRVKVDGHTGTSKKNGVWLGWKLTSH